MLMDYKKIQILLEKYWDGKTSLEEEKTLRDYFNSETIDKNLIQYKSLFNFIKKEQKIKINPSFSIDLNKGKVRNLSWKRYLAVACVFLISGFFIWNFNAEKTNHDIAQIGEIENPEEAYQIAKEALYLVSMKLNHGTSKASEKINKVKDINRFIKYKK